MDMMHAGDMTHKRTWSKYDILWCQNCCYWSLCSPLCVRFQQNVNFTDIMTLGKTLDVRTTGRTFWSLWRWPWSFSRTAAKLHCWIFRRTLLRYVGPSVCRNTANDMSRPFVCHLSVTLFCFTQTVEVLSNIFAPSSSLGTRTLCIKIWQKTRMERLSDCVPDSRL